MIDKIQNIAPLIQKQFPAFYNEDGANFIQFVKAYYEWMDQQGPIHKARRLDQYNDIDTTTNDFIKYFIDKYLHGIPADILADKTLLEKHVLDIYRAKGSIEGIKLLFRLLYKLEANVYLPQNDILKLSDGKWIVKTYLEVEEKKSNYTFNKQLIMGTTSGATAHVSDAIKISQADRINHLFYITNIKEGPTGSLFIPGEYITYDGLNINDAPKLIGSVATADVLGSTEGNKIGDIFIPSTNQNIGEGLKFVVSGLVDATKSKGIITFKLKDGGQGYTLHSNVIVSYDTATMGAGAGFVVKSIINPQQFKYNLNSVVYSLNTPLNNNFGAPLNSSNIDTVLDAALTDTITTVGTIGSIGSVTSGNRQYNGSLHVEVKEPITYGYGIKGDNGGIWGDNAVITGKPAFGNGMISQVTVLSSGYNFNEGDTIEIENVNDGTYNAEVTLHLDGQGIEEGFWQNNDGFLNSDKFMQDNYYYQVYSYEVQVEKSLYKYIDILKKVAHPIGNLIFSKNLYIDEDVSTFDNQYESTEIYQGIPWKGGTLLSTHN